MRGTLLILVLVFSCVFAQSFTATDTGANDVKVLNYALFLERLEAYFYNTYQARFSRQDFINANHSGLLYDHLNVIKDHENAHVTFLQTALGTAAIQNCTSYSFPVTDVNSYIQVAKLLESTGVSAYDGALNLITNRQYALAAATIATVEARHASYLYNLTTNISTFNPFPNSTDTPLSPSSVINTVASTFSPVGCTAPSVPVSISVVPSSAVLSFYNGTSITPTQAVLDTNDINTLQYALVLEHLEAAFYAKYVDTVTGYPSDTVHGFFRLIGSHETSHVQLLTNALTGLNQNPVGACPVYNFDAASSAGTIGTSYSRFIAVSQVLENTGVSAYDGAVRGITSKTYAQVAATIATVEARHAAFVNDLINPTDASAPFPNNRDTPKNVSDIVNAIVSIITDPSTNVVCGGANLAAILPNDILNLLPVVPTSPPTTPPSPTATPTNAPGTTGSSATSVSASIVMIVAAVLIAAAL